MSSRFSLRALTLAYIVGLIITLAIFVWLGQWDLSAGKWWCSLASFIFAETLGYGYLVRLIGNRRRTRMVHAHLTAGTLILLYGAAVTAIAIIFWLIIPVSLFTYLILHLIAAAVLAAGLIAARAFSGYVEDQEPAAQGETQIFRQTQGILHVLRQDMDNWLKEKDGQLHGLLDQLADKVQFSDPVSHPSLIAMEENLLWQARELEKSLKRLRQGENGNLELSRQLILEIMSDITKRNSQLIALK
ncbi:MAG: hypothetical protein K0R57_407 [Paenibacillaceae bacterium]|jgi:hypothetical protein|nr:hypothetical protein [Paenibacillaceae bacterium]